MYNIDDSIKLANYQGLKATKLLELNATEVLQITLEKKAIFPAHTSPTNAVILVLEGEIIFNINQIEYHLIPFQMFDFPKNEEHWVEAKENSKFLIIR
ncbi:MAG: cupin domain-containing protein [Bacteroidia bacterium]|nr:cupin domain-containing protein [Bacteroidia bacterium]NND26270.1 cupin domain-containing protein [Flavobacteriaceae bacterium]MBT8278519.1 cupin domain-containing protein [Bacteroidia bacterium]NNK61220.1 cupin domain-containing protein [Flavobacteriaceae bacterium]NNL33325.1 cupin domain-containing protein [Flavobacteriaceae bacterium]